MKTTIPQWERVYEAPEIEEIKLEAVSAILGGSETPGGGEGNGEDDEV